MVELLQAFIVLVMWVGWSLGAVLWYLFLELLLELWVALPLLVIGFCASRHAVSGATLLCSLLLCYGVY